MNKPTKLVPIGNSTGVILPKDIMARLRVGPGDELFWTESPGGFNVTASNPEFARKMALAETIMREDRDVLSVLAK